MFFLSKTLISFQLKKEERMDILDDMGVSNVTLSAKVVFFCFVLFLK